MKKIIAIIMLAIMCVSLVGCATEEEMLSNEIDMLRTEISKLEAKREALTEEIATIKVNNGIEKYIITFNIKQTHFTLDISEHLKDSMNDISIQIPVDKEYYDSVEIGDVIDDSFRMGSFVFKSSIGSWRITVEDKTIQ